MGYHQLEAWEALCYADGDFDGAFDILNARGIENNEPGETGGGGGGGGGSSSEGGARGNYRESRVDSCETISFDSDGASTTPSVVSPLRQVTDMEYTKDQDGALNSLVLNVQFYKALDDLVQNVQDEPPSGPEDRHGGGSTTPQHEPAVEQGNNLCVVCMDRAVNCTLVPCGHHCFCYDACASRLEKCPICSAAIAQKIRTYNA